MVYLQILLVIFRRLEINQNHEKLEKIKVNNKVNLVGVTMNDG